MATTTKATTKKATKATVKTTAKKATAAQVAKTFAVGKATTHVCRTCGERKAITTFPTTAKPDMRGTQCRACRDAV